MGFLCVQRNLKSSVLTIAIMFISINILVDLIYAALDPRIKMN